MESISNVPTNNITSQMWTVKEITTHTDLWVVLEQNTTAAFDVLYFNEYIISDKQMDCWHH